MPKLDRKAYIGGSEIASIMGVSRWSSPLRVWAEKTGRLENTVSNLEAVEIGSELEEYVAKRFERKTGFKVRRDNTDFRHEVYEYLVGHIDRKIVSEDAVLECKTTSAYNFKEWEGEGIPVEYVLQVNWYLGLTKKNQGYIAVLIGGQRFLWKEIRFDVSLFDKQVKAAVNFWEEHIVKDIPPVATGLDNETLLELYPVSTGKSLTLQGEAAMTLNNLLEDRSGALEAKKNLEGELEEIDARIKQFIGENDEVETDQYRATWKTISQTRLDNDRLKQDGLYEKYTKQSCYRALRAYDKNKANTKKLKELA